MLEMQREYDVRTQEAKDECLENCHKGEKDRDL